MNLQGHKNDASESRPGYSSLCHWCVWIVRECGFHVKPSLILDFSSCEIVLSGFLQIRSHI